MAWLFFPFTGLIGLIVLAATKDEATVVDVLQRDTGLPPDVVSRYLQALRKSA